MREFFESRIGSASLPDTRVREVGDGAKTRSADGTAIALADAVTPDWTRAAVWEDDRNVVTEVPATLTKSVDYTVLVEKLGRQVSLTTQKPNVRVLIFEPLDDGGGADDGADDSDGDSDGGDGDDNAGGKVYCVLATFLPDEDWGGDASELAIGGSVEGFSGLLVYSLPDGTPIWGWRYEDGKANHTVLFDPQYADLQDPDTRISMGSSAEVQTRSFGPIFIEEVFVVVMKEESTYDRLYGSRSWGGGGGGFSSSIHRTLVGSFGSSIGKPAPKPKKPSAAAPDASKIFENDKLKEDEWKKLEEIIDKILLDCMGGHLYNALDRADKSYSFTLNPAEDSFFDGNGISLKSFDSGALLHEMIHAYQYLNRVSDTSHENSLANREIEAYLAQYRYEQYHFDYAFDEHWIIQHESGFLNRIANLSNGFISKQGTLYSGKLSDFTPRYNQVIKNIKDEYKRQEGRIIGSVAPNFDQDFKNLKNLSEGC